MSKANELVSNIDVEVVQLDTPIVRGEQIIDTVSISKPDTGRLRGVKLFDLLQTDVDTMIKVVPRISSPALAEHEVAALDPADLLAVSTAVVGFFQNKAERTKAKEANKAK